MLRVRVCAFAMAVVLTSGTLPVLAHHSFAAQFDGDKPARLVGVITRIEWTNPHSYFYLKVTDSKGEVQDWACESGAPGPLSRRGWKKGDIKLGDRLVVDGYLARDGSRLIDARRVTLPGGRILYGDTASGAPDAPDSSVSGAHGKSDR